MGLSGKSSYYVGGHTGKSCGYPISIPCQVMVKDITSLWNHAFSRMMTYRDMTVEDVIETIGPREDPNINDCLLALLYHTMNELLLVECELIL